MDRRLLIDIGSTFTKVVAVDLDEAVILGRGQSPSTVQEDVTIGLRRALDQLRQELGVGELEEREALACSSAAGGLRIISVGLVPSLTVEAATRAALGAGGKVIGAYGYKLSPGELSEIHAKSPDMILLAGGTDGGDEEVLLHNARMLASSNLDVPIVVAGNKVVRGEATSLLASAGKMVSEASNVMPEIGTLQVGPCQEMIRQIFMNNITRAKGIDKAKALIKNIIMPTPEAVLRGAQLLSQGYGQEEGIGELMVVDVGGATTDVNSIAHGAPTRAGVMVKGLPEPFAKRTVEGDLGVRYSAVRLLELAGLRRLRQNLSFPLDDEQAQEIVRDFSADIEKIAQTPEEVEVDIALARISVEMGVNRHVGILQVFTLPDGNHWIQTGKDLTEVKNVVGTGGPIVFGPDPRRVLEGTLRDSEDPLLLKPKTPYFFVDSAYFLYGLGLLAEIAPEAGLKAMKKYLRPL